jgi:preprotein translocase subunit SecE
VSAFFQELFRAGLYKRSQGRITRQVTFVVVAVTLALGGLRMMQTLMEFDQPIQYGVPAILVALGAWVTYRLVNYPSFADFLIAVEAEMNKVSWPTRSELIRSSMVVLIMIFVLAAVLFGFDFFWRTFFVHVVPILPHG